MSTQGSRHVEGLYRAQRQAGRTDEEAISEVYKVGAYSGGARGVTVGQMQAGLTVYNGERSAGLDQGEALDEVFLAAYTAARAGAFA